MNHHPKIRCPYCNARVRWNPSNLKLFNHVENGNSRYCNYGGKSVLHYYYEELFYCKNTINLIWQIDEINHSYCGLRFYLNKKSELESKIKWFIENDKITIK